MGSALLYTVYMYLCAYTCMCIATSQLEQSKWRSVCVSLRATMLYNKTRKGAPPMVAGHIDGLTYVHSNLTTGVV